MWREAAVVYTDISWGPKKTTGNLHWDSSIPEFPEYEGGCLIAVVLEDFKVAT